jgi:dihydroxyacetone kinase DhaKLM complex PTS-EIIA-like component DhaM
MENTNLVTAANVNKMKCHINGMVKVFPDMGATFLQVEQAMSMFDYESEEIETIVFAWIKENRTIWTI